MQLVKSWVVRGPTDSEPSASVLAEWQKYEVQAAPPSQQEKLLKSMEEGTSYLGSHVTKAATGVRGLHTQVTTSVTT